MRVRFIVTGDLEVRAIRQSVRRFFPVDVDGQSVDFLPPQKVHEVASTPLPPPDDGVPIPKPFATLANALVQAALRDQDGRPSDIVIALADLELANLDQPEIVVAHARRAVRAQIVRVQAKGGLDGSRVEELVRTRCSFHLMRPMCEAYLFGERAALTRAGAGEPPEALLVDPDVESFETNDPQWLPSCLAYNQRQRDVGITWWRHERHPKEYLAHLVDRAGRHYAETAGGVAGLASLDWPRIPASPVAVKFARSLFEDLAEAFGTTNPLGPGPTAPETWPARTTQREQLTLRNL
jgi:hypothetical protein